MTRLKKEIFLICDLEWGLSFSCKDCTKHRNIKKMNILSIQCICVFHMVLTLNRKFFLPQPIKFVFVMVM